MRSSECYTQHNFQFEEGVEQFEKHSLDEASKLSLMSRFDTKYLLPIELLPRLLRQMAHGYSALHINGTKWHEYETIYLDTPGFEFYMQHHNRRLNRPKVRYRIYNQSGSAFLEVKHKDNKKRTKKKRLPLDSISEVYQTHNQEFLTSLIDPNIISQLLQVLSVQYSRMSFMSLKYGERVSVDIGLRAHRSGGARAYELRDYAIVEVKQSKINRSSPVFQMMRACSCRPLSFSKYCLSCAVLFPDLVRTNRFKRVLNMLSSKIVLKERGVCA